MDRTAYKARSNFRNSGAGNRPPRQPAPSMAELKDGFDSDNLGKLVDEFARKWAKWLADTEGKKKNSGGGLALGKNQLRRFYQDIKALEIRTDSLEFSEIAPLIKMLKPKAAYAYGRKPSLIPKEFVYLVNESVEHASVNIDQFRGFVKFIESLVGYVAFYGKDK